MYRFFIIFFLIVYSGIRLNAQQVTVGVFDNYPLMYKSDNGEIKGLFIDILEHIGNNNGLEVSYRYGTAGECYSWLASGEIDMIGESSIAESRALKYLLTKESVLSTWAAVYSNSDADLNTFFDLEGKRVAIMKNSYFITGQEQGLKKILSDLEIDCEYVDATDYDEIFHLIETGEVDAGVINRVFGDINEVNYDVLPTPIMFSPYRLGYAFSYSSPIGSSLKQMIDTDLASLKENHQSYYYQMLNNYFKPKDSYSLPIWVWILVGAFLLAIIQLVSHIFILRKQVTRRTHGLKRAINEIEEREQLLLLIYNNTRDFIGLIEVISENSFKIKKMPDRLLDAVIKVFPQYTYSDLFDMELAEFYSKILNVDDEEIIKKYEQINEAINTLKSIHFEEKSLFPFGVDGISETAYIPIVFKGKVSHILLVSRSVTEERASREAITQSEERMRLAVQNVPVMLDAFDENGLLVVWNNKCEEITGYTSEEMIGNDRAFELLYPNPTYREVLEKKWKSGPYDYEDETIITCKDGRKRTISWRHQAGTYAIPGWTDWGIGIDVTSEKEAKVALIHSEQLLSSMMDNLPGMFWRLRIDENFSLIFVSEGSKELLGITPEEMLGNGVTPKDFILKEYHELVRGEAYRCVKEMASGELVIPINVGGKVKWVLDRFKAVDIGNGEIVMDGMLIDITDQFENEQRLQMAIDGAREGMWDFNIEEDTLELNEYAIEMFGFGNQKIEKATERFQSLLHPDDVEATQKAFDDQLNGVSDYYEREFRLKTAANEWKWVHTRGRIAEKSPEGKSIRAIGTLIDIDDRKKAELTLAENQVMLSNLMFNLPGMVYRCENEENWPMIFVSEGAFSLTGYSAKELESNDIIYGDLIIDADKERVWNEVQVALKEDRTYMMTYRIKSKGGEVKWVWEQGGTVKETNLLEGFITDITERIESEQRLQLAIDGAGLGMWDWNAITDEITYNDYMAKMLGYRKTELGSTAKSFYKLLHPDDQEKFQNKLVEHLKGKTEYLRQEYRLKTKSGSYKWVITRGRVVDRDADGRATRSLGVHIDIDNRKKTELALSENERRLSNLMSNLPGMVYRCLNDEIGTILFASDGALELTGYSPREFEGQGVTFADITGESDKHRIWREVEEALSKGESYTITYRLKTKDNKYKWVWQQGNLVKGTQFLEGFITDITDRVESEDRIISTVIETEDNERKRIAKELHDSLGQKLTTASLNFNSLKKDLNKEKKGLTKLITGLNNLNSAIKDSREIAHNLMPRSIENFGYVLAVQSMIADIEEVSGIALNFYDNLKGKRLEDKLEVHLYRITQEAINNVLKYSEAKNVTIQLMSYEGDLILTIEDDGKGFDAENVLIGNASFGLKSMRNRVNSLTGNWHVDSSLGNGTLITIELPYKMKTI